MHVGSRNLCLFMFSVEVRLARAHKNKFTVISGEFFVSFCVLFELSFRALLLREYVDVD